MLSIRLTCARFATLLAGYFTPGVDAADITRRDTGMPINDTVVTTFMKGGGSR